MAKKKAGRAGKKAARRQFKKMGSPKKAGARNKDTVKIHAIKPRGNQTIWSLQDALRKDGYFARAIGPAKVVTNAPVKTP